MKKIIYTLLMIGAAMSSHAQTICVPGTLTAQKSAYIIPDSATNFNHGCIGQYYEQILYIKAAKDTTINVTTPIAALLTTDIDSFVVHADVTGLPAYLNVESVPTALLASGGNPKTNMKRMVIPGDSLACVKISGNIPASQTPGLINLVINLRIYTSNIQCPGNPVVDALIPTLYPGRKTDTLTSLTYYSIMMNSAPCWPASLNEIGKPDFILNTVMPNPAQSFTDVSIESPRSQECQLLVLNILGETVFHQTLKLQAGINRQSINTASFPNGLYILNLKGDQGNLSYKFQVQQ